MPYTDSSFLLMLFVLPSLFGLTLIGEGVQKIMNYDNHGWIGVSVLHSHLKRTALLFK